MVSEPGYRVELKPAVVRELGSLQRRDRLRVARAIDGLAHGPRPPRVEKLKGSDDLWRVRVGDFRIIYTVNDDKLLILVIRVGHRRHVYR